MKREPKRKPKVLSWTSSFRRAEWEWEWWVVKVTKIEKESNKGESGLQIEPKNQI